MSRLMRFSQTSPFEKIIKIKPEMKRLLNMHKQVICDIRQPTHTY